MATEDKTKSSKRRSLTRAVKNALTYVKQHARKPSWKVYPRRTSKHSAASSNGTLTSETQLERVATVDVSCERDAEVANRPDDRVESAEPIVEPENHEATDDDAPEPKFEPRLTLTTSQKRVIQHMIKMLDAYGREIWPDFFENPKEPARHTVDACNDSNWIGYGDISMSPYDTAWVAMVPNEQYKVSPTPENFELAFPECFTWLFHSQDADGSWARKGAGSIAPALAGLLALGTFRERAGNLFNQKLAELELSEEKYYQVFDRAVGFLRTTLNAWRITDIDMTGFEIVVPYHMRALAKLEHPVTFEFLDKENLLKANRHKVSLIPIEKIFELAARRHPVTIIHSIEAFSDTIDLGRCQNEGFQAINGSYGSSPAATAAILIHAPQWDEKAHGFLQRVIARRPPCTQHCGNVPTLSDIGIFETNWVMHSVGEVVAKIMQDESTKEQYPPTQELFEKNMAFMDYIEQLLQEQNGILRWVSWDNRIPADIDDTCVSSYLTRQFKPDTPVYLDKIIKMYWADTHFITFPLERTWSASCNTHMLNHLLAERARAQAEGRAPLLFTVMTKTGPRKAPIDNIIRLTLKSIIHGRNEDHVWLDKWNVSPAYTTFKSIDMILSLFEFPDPNLIASTEFGNKSTLLRYCRGSVDWALRSQHSDGTWGEPSDNAEGNVEETSYVVRLLKTARRYWPEDKAIDIALQQGREYLLLHLDEAMTDPEFFHKRQPFLWINKQLYTVPRIIQASVLSALWDK